MIRNETVLEVKKGERSYRLYCEGNSPLGELFDALSEMQGFIVSKIKESQPKKEESPAVEPEVLPRED